MKTIFDPAAREELISRINSLDEKSARQWGKMNAYQMAKHCTIWNEWLLGKENHVYKQEFLGKIFGKMALKSNTKDDRPLGKKMPAGAAFTVREKEGDLKALKNVWAEQIAGYGNFFNPNFVHDFFGKMTKEEIGIFAYKHNDHHLRQFNV